MTKTRLATAAAPNAAKSAFAAESAKRRRPRQAAHPPAAVAYRVSPRATTSAARPSSGSYVSLGTYLDGHFVTSESRSATKTPLTSSPRMYTFRPAWKRSGTEPL